MRKASPRVPPRRPRTDSFASLSTTDDVREHWHRQALLERLPPDERKRFQKRQYWEERRGAILADRKVRYTSDPEYRERRKRESRESYSRAKTGSMKRTLSPIKESRRHYGKIHNALYLRAGKERKLSAPAPRLDDGMTLTGGLDTEGG